MTEPAPSTEPNSKALALRLWREHVSHHKMTLVATLVAIAFVAATTSLYPLIINWAFDALAKQSGWVVTTLPWLVLLAGIGKAVSLYTQVALTQRVVTHVETDMQRQLYAHLVDADLAQITAETPAAWVQRFTTDLIYIRGALTRVIGVLVRDGLTIIALVATMIYLDWVLSVIALVILPLALIPVSIVGRILNRVARSTQEQTAEMASLASESFGAARVVKTYQLEGYLNARANRLFESLRLLRLKAALRKGIMEPATEALGAVAVAAILVTIGWRIVAGDSTVGEFTGFMGALLIASQPIRALSNLNAIVQEGLSALARYYAVIDTVPTVTDRAGAVPATFGAGTVQLDDVTFRYAPGAPAVTNLSFDAPAGCTTAIVGRSGAGKSTVFNLVARLYDPDAGRVLIGGEDLAGLTVESVRARIAVVSQDIVLFNDTVAANIALGREGATRAEIEHAAELAGAAAFIRRHPDGFDALVGERGANFSGGERQRIALARAFLKDAPVLLLDEATSALDAESEQAVREGLARLSTGRTTLVIAHRLATVRRADRIIVMDAGTVAEVGTHEELVAQGGLYARFHALQLLDE